MMGHPRLGPLGVPLQRGQFRNVHLLGQLRDVPFPDGVGVGRFQPAGLMIGQVGLMLAPVPLVGDGK